MKVKDCTFVGKGFASTSDGTAIYENCVVTGLEGSAGVFKNCTIFPGDYFRSDLYFYDCIFKDMTGEGREVNVRILLNKRFGFYNCKFPETTCISYGNAAYFENCDFNYFCNRLYRINNNRITSGRKVSRTWNNRWYGRYLLGQEQRTFNGRCTC